MKLFLFISFLTIPFQILSQQQNSSNINKSLQNLTQSNPLNTRQNSNNIKNTSLQDMQNTI